MSTQNSWNESGTLTLIASATIDQYEQVKITGNGKCAPAGSAERAVGVAMIAATATGKLVNVDLYNRGGTFPGIALASVTAGAKVFAAAGGLVKAAVTSANGVPIGVCVNGATVTGGRIEFAPLGSIAAT